MICPNCGRETFGTVCSNCKTPLYDRTTGEIEQEYPAQQERWETERQERYEEQRQGRYEEQYQEQHQEQRERQSSRAKKDAAPKAASKGEQKEKKLLEKRIKTLEAERQQRQKTERQQERTDRRQEGKDRSNLNRRERDNYISDREEETEKRSRSRTRSRRRGGDDGDSSSSDRRQTEYRETSSGPSLADAAFKGVTGVVVLASRIMQIICVLLMACMVWVTARSFLSHSSGLGNLETMITDRNYGLALYVGAAGVTLLMGVIWCLWTASRKAAGGNIRLKKYDTGRGFVPFILCAAAVFGVRSAAAALVPADPAAWQGLAAGASTALAAVNANYTLLVSCSVTGIVLSLVRKLLRV